MATILIQPDLYSFAGNLKNIVVISSAKISFTLKRGTDVLLQTTYDPGVTGRIEIDIKKIIQDLLTSELPAMDAISVKDFPAFAFSVDSEAEILFYVFKGGVDAYVTSDWFAENFLTWMPQTNYVHWNQAQYLSYVALQLSSVKIKGYFSDGTDQTVLFVNLVQNKINTLNLQYSSLPVLFENKQPQYIDVWVENAEEQRMSYIQRLVLKNSSPDDNYFLFENSLGGWDSICFDGKLKNEGTSDVKTFSQEDVTSEYQVDAVEKYLKNTGYFVDDRHRLWAFEFFKTKERYFLSHREFFEKIVVLSSTIASQKTEPSSYNFSFSLSNSTKFINLSRTETPDLPLQIVDPAGDLFFLAPRLSEFSVYSNDAGLIPIQSPFVAEWHKINLGSLKSSIKDSVFASPIFNLIHSHTNLSLLDKFTVNSSGKLLFNGKAIASDDKINPHTLIIPQTLPDILATEIALYALESGFNGELPIGEIVEVFVGNETPPETAKLWIDPEGQGYDIVNNSTVQLNPVTGELEMFFDPSLQSTVYSIENGMLVMDIN